MENSGNRIVILFGTMLAQLGLGSLYTWSLFNSPLATLHNFTLEQVVLSFSITSFSLAIGTLFAGKLQDIFGIRLVVIGCSIILGLGLIFAPHCTDLWQLYISAGFIVGFVDGIAYILTLSNCIKWFPNAKGLISGISVGCYGLGSLVFKYINADLISNLGVIKAFMYWGILAFILVFIGAILLKDAPSYLSYSDEFDSSQKQFTRKELFTTPQSYLLFIAFFSSCLSGLYLIGTAKNIAIIIAHLTPVLAGTSVALIAIFNTLGRIILGTISDKLGRTKVSAFAFLLIFLSVVTMLFTTLSYTSFTISICAIAFAFGGNLTVFPAIVGEYFGLENHSKNYGIIYQGFGVGGLLGGVIANIMGGFTPTFWLMLVVSFISIIIMLFIKAPIENRKPKNI